MNYSCPCNQSCITSALCDLLQIKVTLNTRLESDTREGNTQAGDNIDLECGSHVAIWLEKYQAERPPYIAQILSTKTDSLVVQWWTGSYSGVWKPCTQRLGRQTVPWQEEVPQTSIIANVSFSKSNRLTEVNKNYLKELYSEYDI